MKNAKGFINIVWCDRRGREARGKITFVQESNGEICQTNYIPFKPVYNHLCLSPPSVADT